MPTLPGIEILLQEAMKLDFVEVSVGIKGVESSSPLISIFSSEDMHPLGLLKFIKRQIKATESKILNRFEHCGI